MFVKKIGAHHLEMGMNCQDYGFEGDHFKLVCDGCSQGKHTEVGAKAYCHLASLGFGIRESFEKLAVLFGQSDDAIKHFLCFTILQVKENDTHYLVSYCGDGYVILQHMDGTVSFEELTDGEFPSKFVIVNDENIYHFG